MTIKRTKFSLRGLLTEAKDLPLNRVPYGRFILLYLPEGVEIYPTDPASLLLQKLVEHKDEHFLNQQLDEFLGVVETHLRERIFRVSAWIALTGSAAFLGLIGYTSFTTNTFPSWELFSLAMGAPAFLVMDRFGITRKMSLTKVGTFIKNVRRKKTSEPDSYEPDDYGSSRRGDGDPYRD